MDTNDKDSGQGMWPDDDKVIYIPDEEYHSIMRSLRKLEEAQREFHKIRDSLKPNDSNNNENQSPQ